VSALAIKIAESAGFCWGVERALEIAREAVGDAPGPINTLGPLIHNPGVIAELRAHGVGVIAEPGEAEGGTVILRAHGVPRETKEKLDRAGFNVLDATCRFVRSAQDKAAQMHSAGYRVIILGERDHPEVLALRSYAGTNSLVVEDPKDLPADFVAPRVGVVVQTTQSKERLADLSAYLATRCRELLVHNTICNATEQRQTAAIAMAREVDVVIVVGGRNSGNTTRLAELCATLQPLTYHIEAAEELRPEWFGTASSVGITAGASTPAEQIQAVVDRIRELDA
jgi:4-hydroxy-3-methylbut-2-enyl diphosphate reductase